MTRVRLCGQVSRREVQAQTVGAGRLAAWGEGPGLTCPERPSCSLEWPAPGPAAPEDR